jgi:hypothetical protein
VVCFLPIFSGDGTEVILGYDDEAQRSHGKRWAIFRDYPLNMQFSPVYPYCYQYNVLPSVHQLLPKPSFRQFLLVMHGQVYLEKNTWSELPKTVNMMFHFCLTLFIFKV